MSFCTTQVPFLCTPMVARKGASSPMIRLFSSSDPRSISFCTSTLPTGSVAAETRTGRSSMAIRSNSAGLQAGDSMWRR